MSRPTAVAYLMKELNNLNDFRIEWVKLSDADKATLRQWAEDEMTAFGL